MLGRATKLASGVAVPVFLPTLVSLAVKDLPALTGSGTASLAARLVSASASKLLTSALPLLLTASLTAEYTCARHATHEACVVEYAMNVGLC